MKFVHLSILIFLFILANNTVAATVPYDFGDKTEGDTILTKKVLRHTMLPRVSQRETMSFDIWQFGNIDNMKRAFKWRNVEDWPRHHREHAWIYESHRKHHLPTEPSIVPIPKSSWLLLSGVALIGTIVARPKPKQ